MYETPRGLHTVHTSSYSRNHGILGPILLGLSGPDEEDEKGDFVEVKEEKPTGNDDPATDTSLPAWEDLPPHKDEAQVQLDVDRSFVYYPNRMTTILQFPPKSL